MKVVVVLLSWQRNLIRVNVRTWTKLEWLWDVVDMEWYNGLLTKFSEKRENIYETQETYRMQSFFIMTEL